MENSLSILIGGIVITLFLVMGGVISLKRQDSKANKASDALSSVGNHVWSYLTPAQQEELSHVDLLAEQEEWIEKHVDPSVLNGASAEKVLIELANRGFIGLGKGTFKRHASVIDFIEQVEPTGGSTETVEQQLREEPQKTISAVSDEIVAGSDESLEPVEDIVTEEVSEEQKKRP